MFGDPSRLMTGVRTYRVSSWDRTGRNIDYLVLEPGQTVTLLDTEGRGRIAHFYWTSINASRFHFRQLVLRAWWDGEANPSIEVPLGDFFCVPHCTPVPVRSLAVVVNPGASYFLSWGLNMYLPMPFAFAARIELAYEPLQNHFTEPMSFWYHLDMEEWSEPPPPDMGRFHAQWRRENPTTSNAGVGPVTLWDGVNLDGLDNYVAVEAAGRGQMVGLHLQVDNLPGGWYGEGDDMVYVDGHPGQQWPPTYHGTGSEEVFGGGACPNEAYAGPYTGFHLIESPDFSGKNAMYRWYMADPIRFERSLVWTIEHGHANNFENDYCSVAYWYQTEPHAPFPTLSEASARLPRFAEIVFRADAARARAMGRYFELITSSHFAEGERLDKIVELGSRALRENRLEDAISIFEDVH